MRKVGVPEGGLRTGKEDYIAEGRMHSSS